MQSEFRTIARGSDIATFLQAAGDTIATRLLIQFKRIKLKNVVRDYDWQNILVRNKDSIALVQGI